MESAHPSVAEARSASLLKGHDAEGLPAAGELIAACTRRSRRARTRCAGPGKGEGSSLQPEPPCLRRRSWGAGGRKGSHRLPSAPSSSKGSSAGGSAGRGRRCFCARRVSVVQELVSEARVYHRLLW